MLIFIFTFLSKVSFRPSFNAPSEELKRASSASYKRPKFKASQGYRVSGKNRASQAMGAVKEVRHHNPNNQSKFVAANLPLSHTVTLWTTAEEKILIRDRFWYERAFLDSSPHLCANTKTLHCETLRLLSGQTPIYVCIYKKIPTSQTPPHN